MLFRRRQNTHARLGYPTLDAVDRFFECQGTAAKSWVCVDAPEVCEDWAAEACRFAAAQLTIPPLLSDIVASRKAVLSVEKDAGVHEIHL